MSKGVRNNVPVDYTLFMGILEKRHLNVYDLSEEIGYTKKVLQGKAHKGAFASSDAMFLEKFYNIPRESYAPVKKVQEVPAADHQEPEVKVPNYADISKLIYAAVYAAVKDAWEDKPPKYTM